MRHKQRLQPPARLCVRPRQRVRPSVPHEMRTSQLSSSSNTVSTSISETEAAVAMAEAVAVVETAAGAAAEPRAVVDLERTMIASTLSRLL